MRPDEGLRVGEYFADRYTVCRELGVGGMATVYLARVDGPGGFEKFVALKRVHPHLLKSQRIVDMFLDEARIVAKLNHPNVCSVFDFGRAHGALYLAMDYVVGETLLSVMSRVTMLGAQLANRRWSLCAARIIAQAAQGLHAAHELTDADGNPLNVIHRDVSPHNIFVAYNGSVKVMDFGIAASADQIHHSQMGKVTGKVPYMAREQLAEATSDRRVDIWALGVCLWEMLARRKLYADNETALSNLFIKQPPPDVREYCPEAPSQLVDVLSKALQHDRDKRYGSARELANDLDRVIAHTGDPLGLSELGDLMAGLFAREHTSRLKVLDRARHTAVPAARPTWLKVSFRQGSAAIVLGVVIGLLILLGVFRHQSRLPTTPAIITAGARSATPAQLEAAPARAVATKAANGPDRAERRKSKRHKKGVATPEKRSVARRGGNNKAAVEKTLTAVAASSNITLTQGELASPPAAMVSPQVTNKKSALDASVTISALKVAGSLAPAEVRLATRRIEGSLAPCYRNAARQSQRDWAGNLTVSFEIDESRLARRVTATSAGIPGLSTCIRDAFAKVRTRIPPDVGVTSVHAKLIFAPREVVD